MCTEEGMEEQDVDLALPRLRGAVIVLKVRVEFLRKLQYMQVFSYLGEPGGN